ncbi:transposase [Limnoglobus roseus]|uniref:Transposase n=1 Tax=Limnoglobus roseus TaxID=2598579 RepID=A0A5C1ACB9_9BACT|nr:transposase [Limnoglobus roseus]QEL16380.1 transposase [Limnoglobus roseus]
MYVLITGIGWEFVPPGFPCGKAIKTRPDRWLAIDAFRTAWQPLADRYQDLHGINWDQVLIDGSKRPSKRGTLTGPNPADRTKSGTAIHLATGGRGLPLGAVVAAANVNDGMQTRAVVDDFVIRPRRTGRTPTRPPGPTPRSRGRRVRERAGPGAGRGGRLPHDRPAAGPRRPRAGRCGPGSREGTRCSPRLAASAAGSTGTASDTSGGFNLPPSLIFLRHQANGFFR